MYRTAAVKPSLAEFFELGNVSPLKGLKKEPPEGDIMPVAGQPGNFRLIIESYRALFRYRDDHVYISHLDPRGQVYNKKNKGGKR